MVAPEVIRSLARCASRLRVLDALADRGRAFPAQLARAARVDPRRLNAIMHGDLPGYSVDLGLATLDLVREDVDPHGLVYVITPEGLHARREVHDLLTRGASRLPA